MRMPVRSLVPVLLLPWLLAVSSGAQQPASSASEGASREALAQTNRFVQEHRQRTRFRVLDRQGKPWVGAHLSVYSRPCAGMEDIVEGETGKRGRSTLQLLPGRAYVAWAWGPVQKGEGGEYRVTELHRRVGVGGILTLREGPQTRLRVRLDLVGMEKWKGPLRARFTGNLGLYGGVPFDFEASLEGKQVTLPVSPVQSGMLYILDAENHLVASVSVPCSRSNLEKLFETAKQRRKKLEEAEEAKRKREEARRQEGEAGKESAAKTQDGEAGAEPVAKKVSAPVVQKQAVQKQGVQKQKSQKTGKQKQAPAPKAVPVQVVQKVPAFQVVKLGALIQGGNVMLTRTNVQPTIDYVALGRATWRLGAPYHYKVRIEDKKTKAPIAGARLFQTLSGWIEYEMGRTDDKGIAVVTMAMQINEKTGRPKRNYTNFRVLARGYPETYVQRNNLKLPKSMSPEALMADDVKPVFVSKLNRGFGVKGRVLLAEGRPLAHTSLLIRTGMVYDYGNQNMGFNQNGSVHSIQTDAEGRFDYPSCDGRFVLSISAILRPDSHAALAGDERFPTSARVLLYQNRGKAAKGGMQVMGGIAMGRGAFRLAQPKKDAKKKGKQDGKKKEEPKPEKPVIRDLGDLRIDSLTAVRVQIVRADGLPTAHARIGIASLKAGQNYLAPPLHLGNHLGRVRILVPGTDDYVLGCGIEGQAQLVKLALPAKEPISMQLEAGLALEGRVVDPNGDPIEGAYIYAYPYGGVKVLHQGLWNALRGGNSANRSLHDGTFSVPILPNVTYSFQVNYNYKNRNYNIGQRLIDIDDSSQDLGDIEVPVPVAKKKKAATRKLEKKAPR